MVKPESIVEPWNIFAVAPLLPVKPPEVNSELFKWPDDTVEIRICPFDLTDSEWIRGKKQKGKWEE